MSEGGREFRINPPPPFERKDQDDLCPAVVHQRGPLKVGDGGEGGGGWGNCFWLRTIKDRRAVAASTKTKLRLLYFDPA